MGTGEEDGVMAGFIKIHRGLLKWGWYKDPNTTRVFLDILLHTNYEDGEYMGHPVLTGQCVIGREALSERLGISERSVRTALSHLKSTGEITIKSTNKFSIATVTNWEKYQCQDDESDQQNDQQTDQQVTNNRPASDQQVTTSKKFKESKKYKEGYIYTSETSEIVAYLNEMTGKSYRPSTRKTKDLITARLREGFTVEDFKTVIFKKASEWKGTEFEKFIRPETLFGTKFEGYLNQSIPTQGGRLDWIDDL